MSESKLAANMRSLRDLHGYTQQDVSSRIHVARQTYSVYECGKRMPDTKTLCLLADLYQIPLDQLLHGDFTGARTSEDILREHSAVMPDESLIRLTGADAKMIMDYKNLPAEVQKEIREYVRFKKHLLARENPS